MPSQVHLLLIKTKGLPLPLPWKSHMYDGIANPGERGFLEFFGVGVREQ
jgi:hypothetical protein